MYDIAKDCQIDNLGEIYMSVFGYKTEGTFVEVGAYDGERWSNTNCLGKIGWYGLLFEPVPKLYKKCVKYYKKYPNIKIIKACIGDYDGETKVFVGDSLTTTSSEMVDIYNNIDWSSHSGLNKKKYIKSPIYKLDTMLTKNSWPENFDVLGIDTEGTELNVLKCFDIKKWKPKLVIVEAHEKHQDKVLGKNSPMINDYFKKAGYKKIYCDQINSIFLKD